MLQPVSVPSHLAAYSRPLHPIRQPQPRFGMLNRGMGHILKDVVLNTTKEAKSSGKGIGRFLSWTGAVTTLLTILFANGDATLALMREKANMFQNRDTPLVSVLPRLPETAEGEDGITRAKIAAMIEKYENKEVAWLTKPMLEDYIKAGLVEALLTPNEYTKTIVPGLGGWQARLIDGSEIVVNIGLNDAEQFYHQYNIPTTVTLSGFTLSWLEATLLAGALGIPVAGMLQSLTESLGRRRKKPKPEPLPPLENRQREASYVTGIFLVAKKLGVTDDLLTEGEVSRRAERLQPAANETSLTRSELKKRLTVLMSGEVAEAMLHGDDPSVESLGTRGMATRIADFMIRKLGLGKTIGGPDIPAKLDDETERKLQGEVHEILAESVSEAKTVLASYPPEKLTALRDAFVANPDLKDDEALDIVNGRKS